VKNFSQHIKQRLRNVFTLRVPGSLSERHSPIWSEAPAQARITHFWRHTTFPTPFRELNLAIQKYIMHCDVAFLRRLLQLDYRYFVAEQGYSKCSSISMSPDTDWSCGWRPCLDRHFVGRLNEGAWKSFNDLQRRLDSGNWGGLLFPCVLLVSL
jgi:hypothetical protein